MPWFDGQPLLGHLEDVHIASDRNLVDNRFPVQYVIRPQSAEHRDYRGFAGSVVGGIFKQGDEVMVLPSRKTSKIAAIDTPDGAVAQAFPPMAVTLRLEDELDISRGDMICRPTNQPTASRRFEAMICWFDETSHAAHRRAVPAEAHDPLGRRRGRGRCATGSTSTPCTATSSAETLEVNDIGRVAIHTTSPLFFDEYRLNRTTGSFILVDPATDLTVAAGMIIGAGGEPSVPTTPTRSSPRTSPSTRASSRARSAGARSRRAARRSG